MPWPSRSAGGTRTASGSVTGTRAWRRVRDAVLARDGGACQLRLAPCLGAATTVDHIRAVAAGGDPLSVDNGQAACVPCHGVKTAGDAQRGRVRERRAPEVHPGLLGP